MNVFDLIFEKTGLDLEPSEVLYKAKEVVSNFEENLVDIKNEVQVKAIELIEKL